MYCHRCIRSFAEDAIYCSQCGRRLDSHQLVAITDKTIWDDMNPDANTEQSTDLDQAVVRVETTIGDVDETSDSLESIDQTNVEDDRSTMETEMNASKSWFMSVWLICLTIAVGIGVWSYYQYETNINEQVLKLQADAKAATLAGRYLEALDYLDEAIQARPTFLSLQTDEQLVQHVAELDRMMTDVEDRVNTGATEEALRGLEQLKIEFNGHKEPAYMKQLQRLADLDKKLTIVELSNDVNGITTFKQHTDMLNIVNGLMGEEAANLREQIVTGIRKLTLSEVDIALGKRYFKTAQEAITRALVWIKNDEELLLLQQHVKDEQIKFEQREQQRIEQAMQSAAEEDLINQTDAIVVVSTEQYMNEYGDMWISGVLQSVATVPIYDVTIEYSIKGLSGMVITSGIVNASPDYVEPGEEMTFTVQLTGMYSEDFEIEIDHAAWYLD